MLKIKSKKEVEEAVYENVNRFTHTKKALIEKNLQRDEAIIISEILPRLRHTIALTHYVRKVEWFNFSLPLIEMAGYDVSEEEKEVILQAYYHQEGVLWVDNGHRGEIGKASLVKEIFEEFLQTSVAFKSCEVNLETNTVDFTLHLVDKMLKLKVKEERTRVTAVFDEYLLPHLHFNSIADKINACYDKLQEEELLIVNKSDLEAYPLAALNMDAILNEADFYEAIELTGHSGKIDIQNYVKESKLIKSLNRKVRKYGYVLRYTTTRSKEDTFRSNGIDIYLDATYPSQDVNNLSLVKSEELRALFNERQAAYEAFLNEKALKENEKLLELVASGHFDALVTTTWLQATLMSTRKITDADFKGERNSDELPFRFTAPFDRQLPELKSFKPMQYNGNGIGCRYMKLDDNILTALKKRYPFFENAHLFGESDKDFQAREGVFNSDTHRFIPDTLTFGFLVGRTTYVLRKKEILNWLASAYGVLPIEDILKEIDFHEEGISKKIESYVQHHQAGNTSTKQPFKITLGSVASDQLLDLYEASPLSAKSKDLFDEAHEDEFWSYGRLKEAYKVAVKEEFQSLKLANLFTHALLVHPLYTELKEALQALDYELTVEYKKENLKKMATGNTNIHGEDIPADVCTYSVQLVIV